MSAGCHDQEVAVTMCSLTAEERAKEIPCPWLATEEVGRERGSKLTEAYGSDVSMQNFRHRNFDLFARDNLHHLKHSYLIFVPRSVIDHKMECVVCHAITLMVACLGVLANREGVSGDDVFGEDRVRLCAW